MTITIDAAIDQREAAHILRILALELDYGTRPLDTLRDHDGRIVGTVQLVVSPGRPGNP